MSLRIVHQQRCQVTSIPDCTTHDKHALLPFQVLSSTGKRKGVACEQSKSVNRKRVKNVGFIPMREHAKVIEQLAVVHEQNEIYLSTWMRKYSIILNTVKQCESRMLTKASPGIFHHGSLRNRTPQNREIG